MTTRTERERGTAVRARAIRARKAWRQHRQICRLCAQLSSNRSQYCDAGWDIRVELHHAERALSDFTRPTPVRQDPLF